MERRNTIVALAVAGAVAVGMVSCATRCVANRAQDGEGHFREALDGPVDGVGFDLGVDLGGVLDGGLHQFPRKDGPGEKVGLFGEFKELTDGGVRVENGLKQDDECLFALLTSVHGCSSVS